MFYEKQIGIPSIITCYSITLHNENSCVHTNL